MKTILVCLALVCFFSCRSNKDLTYFKDVEKEQLLNVALNQAPVYIIQADDNLFVSIVTSNEEMNKIYNPAQVGTGNGQGNINVYNEIAGRHIFGYQVDSFGNISLPMIGKVTVEGKNFKEAEEAVLSKAKEYLKEVTVKIRLLNYKVTVMGEVNKPGVYFNFNTDFTIFDALSFAGGTTDFAKVEKVMVLRKTKEGNRSLFVDLRSKKLLLSEAYFIQPNDVIYVEPSIQKNIPLKTPIYALGLSTITTFVLLWNVLSR